MKRIGFMAIYYDQHRTDSKPDERTFADSWEECRQLLHAITVEDAIDYDDYIGADPEADWFPFQRIGVFQRRGVYDWDEVTP